MQRVRRSLLASMALLSIGSESREHFRFRAVDMLVHKTRWLLLPLARRFLFKYASCQLHLRLPYLHNVQLIKPLVLSILTILLALPGCHLLGRLRSSGDGALSLEPILEEIERWLIFILSSSHPHAIICCLSRISKSFSCRLQMNTVMIGYCIVEVRQSKEDVGKVTSIGRTLWHNDPAMPSCDRC